MSTDRTALAWDHLHLNAADSNAAAAWYVEAFGPWSPPGIAAERVVVVGLQGARFGRHQFRWFDAEAEGSVGSVVDHYGWSVTDVDAACTAFEAAGAKLLEEPRTVGESLRICFLEDPWGAKFELLDDPDLLGFHHVHLLVPDPESHRRHLAELVGGEPSTFNDLLPGVRRDDGPWVLYRAAAGLAPSLGRAIDHMAFTVQGLEERLDAMSAAGAKVEGPPRDVDGARIGFAAAHDGARIELVEPQPVDS
ncbi:MAG: VOC family protein [Acidobacteriota bacterium]